MKKLMMLFTVLALLCGTLAMTACTEEEHKLVHHEAKEATCSATGNTEYWECTECSKYFSDEDAENEITDKDSVIIAKKAHTWTEVVTKTATYTQAGSRTKTCSVCQETETETIPALSYTADATVQAGESISAAINAAENGDIIVVKEGTYAEQIVITGKNLTIIGEGNVVITGPEDYTTIAAVPAIAGESTAYSGLVSVQNAEVTLENITVKGDIEKARAAVNLTHNSRYLGVAALNADLTLNYIKILDIRFTEDYLGMQNGIALYAVATDEDKDLTVRYSEISNFNKGAVVVRASVNHFLFEGNTVKGVGEQGITAQNGVQISCAATVCGNTIQDMKYSPAAGTPGEAWAHGSVAIYIYLEDKTTPVSVTDNVIKNCDNGIYGYEGSTTVSGNTFEQMCEEDGCYEEYLEPAEEE